MEPVETTALTEPILIVSEPITTPITSGIDPGQDFPDEPGTFVAPHQTIVSNLAGPFLTFFPKKSCQVFVAPLDVPFPRKSKKDGDIITVLQPD